MRKQPHFSDETVKAAAAHIHHHRQAARMVDATLGVVVEYMRTEQLGADAPSSEHILESKLREALEHLRDDAVDLQKQLRVNLSPTAEALVEQWQVLQQQLSSVIGRTDAAGITTTREYAIAARRLAGITLGANETARRKQSVKDARDHAVYVHRLTCLYDLIRARQLLADTTDGLLVPINILEGKPISEAVTKPVNVPEVVRQSVAAHTSAARRKGITFEDSYDCASAFVAIRENDLQQALQNVFSNAIKYTGELGPSSEWDHTWIRVIVNADSETVKIAIQSWGAPFTPEELLSGSVFNWGTRGHFSWKVAGAEGSGIGLSDAKRNITRVGGRITIESDPVERHSPLMNKVTTVTIYLPRLDE
jgi:signal transduction histidine kinase